MLLAVDIGNTRMKWGLHDGQDWIQLQYTAQGVDDLLARLAAQPDQVIVSNVSHAAHDRMLFDAFAHLPHHLARAESEQCGVRSHYRHVRQLGSDRWAALIGACDLGAGTAIVVNAGTALTADALHQGEFLGGTIGPGYRLMRESLAQHTRLPVDGEMPLVAFPTDTHSALTGGCLGALLGNIERMRAALSGKVGAGAEIWLCGGDAPRLSPHLTCRTETHLVLHGLYCIAREVFA